MRYSLIDSPLGNILITATDQGVHHILFEDMREAKRLLDGGAMSPDSAFPFITSAQKQLTDYFSGQRQTFDIPLAAAGTAFQQKVWRQLSLIPYAQIRSYGQLALELCQPTAARAVGMANGKNPLSIVVPCHRVIGKNQALTGYAGGLERKAWLLDLEARYR